MPNHVHVLIKTLDWPLDKIIHSWKSYTAQIISKRHPEFKARFGKVNIGIGL